MGHSMDTKKMAKVFKVFSNQTDRTLLKNRQKSGKPVTEQGMNA